MKIFFLLSLVTSLISFGLPPELLPPDDAQKAAKAQELMKQCRAALGSDQVKALAITGTSRQKMGELESGGDLELEMLLPDKFYKSSVMSPMAGMEITRLDIMNGENAWMDTQNNAPAGGHMVFRVAGNVNGNSLDAQKAQQLFQRQEWTRVLLGMLGQGPASVPLEFSYAGEAEAPDGVADVIEVKGKGIGFSAQLFLDQKTHRPLMLSYQGRKPRATVMRSFSQAEGGKAKTPEELEKDMKEAREKAQAAAAEPMVEIQLRYEDYQSEGGVQLPHRISRTIDGQITEEWTLTKFKINPNIKADKFEKK
jgi:hypothetical protein